MIRSGFSGIWASRKDPHSSGKKSLGIPLVLFTLGTGIVFVAASYSPEFYFHGLIDEDGLLEYASAMFWLLAAIAALATLILTRPKSTRSKMAYLLLIAFFVVCCGEEISWGQRLLGFEGPEVITSINKQGETTLHNIGSISVFANTFLLITIAFFLFYPALLSNRKGLRDSVCANDLPVVTFYATVTFVIVLTVWLILGIRFGTLGFHPFSLWGYYTQMDDEVFEFYAAFSFFVFALLDFQMKHEFARATTRYGKQLST